MTINEFLQTDEAKKASLKTDFATCKVDDEVHRCLHMMNEGGREWLGVMDDTYLMGGVRRRELLAAIEKRKPGDRWEVEQSTVGPFSYPLTVVAHPGDDAAEIGRRLVVSQQPDLVVIDDADKPVAVVHTSALVKHPALREEVQKSLLA